MIAVLHLILGLQAVLQTIPGIPINLESKCIVHLVHWNSFVLIEQKQYLVDLGCYYYNFGCYKRLDDLEAAAVSAVLQSLVVVVGCCSKIGCCYFLDFNSDNFS